MPNITLSCGHEVDDYASSHYIFHKAMERDGSKAISYSVVCGPCREYLLVNREMFEDDCSAFDWLETEEW